MRFNIILSVLFFIFSLSHILYIWVVRRKSIQSFREAAALREVRKINTRCSVSCISTIGFYGVWVSVLASIVASVCVYSHINNSGIVIYFALALLFITVFKVAQNINTIIIVADSQILILNNITKKITETNIENNTKATLAMYRTRVELEVDGVRFAPGFDIGNGEQLADCINNVARNISERSHE
jgi:hypothetical protein